MNAPFIITPAAKARTEARELAAEILTGKYDASGPWLTTANFTPSEWRTAAQWCVDTDDCDDMLFMMAQERAFENGEDLNQAERWADEADYRHDMMRDEQMLAAWERGA